MEQQQQKKTSWHNVPIGNQVPIFSAIAVIQSERNVIFWVELNNLQNPVDPLELETKN